MTSIAIACVQSVEAQPLNGRRVYLELRGKSHREDLRIEAAEAFDRMDAESQASVREAVASARSLWSANASLTEVIESGPWARDGDWLIDQSGRQAPCHIRDLEARDLWSTRLLAIQALVERSRAALDAAQRVLNARLEQVRKAERLIELELSRVAPARPWPSKGVFGQPAPTAVGPSLYLLR